MDAHGQAREGPARSLPSAAGAAPSLALAAHARAALDLRDATGTAGDLATLLGDLAAARRIALRLAERGDRSVRAGDLHAFGLVHAYQRRVVGRLGGADGGRWARALAWLSERYGSDPVAAMLASFERAFDAAPSAADDAPAEPAPADDATAGERPAGAPADDPTKLGSLVLLWLANANPAASPFRLLFDDAELEAATGYRAMIASLEGFFAGEDGQVGALFAALDEPIRRAPSSPGEQLQAVFAAELGTAAAAADGDEARSEAVDRGERRAVLRALDVLREEAEPGFVPGPPPPPEVPDFAKLAPGTARYAAERPWMRSLVLVAKNVLVWLDQLGRRQGRELSGLDDIPEAELAALRSQGMTGLWLIGIWRRSEASARIKKLCGNPDAAASAYAIDDYEVDPALGGESALACLAGRAARHGIRLACDMVPNHLGIDSRWVIEHPDRFLRLDAPPFPGYAFDAGPDLSPDPRVAIHLEDGYYDRRDAAVVFRRRDRASGDIAYLYHGNDGTGLPWNDTAQLDVLRADTRAAVRRQIVRLAERFPILRFDAAMTLARRHVQRLWHPLPGHGGAIPSRAEHALDQETFDARMPEELWREVVDAVAAEAPDTLLLAEAFWLMESYFVRTLGLHRVYNSAFMHMLAKQDHARFHRFVAEALAFDPALVGRFVSFATTPDEAPAAEQLGTGDRAFAVATLLASMPGTPLFGHGQIEGLAERYGMEYRRAYREEQPDDAHLARHRREIAPLLARRAALAGADAFELYEVAADTGPADTVIALSNRCGAARALVLVNNGPTAVRGRIARTVPRPRGDDPVPARLPISGALGVPAGGAVVGRDLLDDRPVRLDQAVLAGEGLRFSLGPYGRLVLVDLVDEALAGPAGDAAIEHAVTALLDPALIGRLLDLRAADEDPAGLVADAATGAAGDAAAQPDDDSTTAPPPPLDDLRAAWSTAAAALDTADASWAAVEARCDSFLRLRGSYDRADADTAAALPRPPGDERLATRARWAGLLAWLLVDQLEAATAPEDGARGEALQTAAPRAVRVLLASLGAATTDVRRQAAAACLFLQRGTALLAAGSAHALLTALDDEAQSDRNGKGHARELLGRNRHGDVDWFRSEGLRALGWWLVGAARLAGDRETLARAATVAAELARLEAPSGYRWRDLLRLAEAAAKAG